MSLHHSTESIFLDITHQSQKLGFVLPPAIQEQPTAGYGQESNIQGRLSTPFFCVLAFSRNLSKNTRSRHYDALQISTTLASENMRHLRNANCGFPNNVRLPYKSLLGRMLSWPNLFRPAMSTFLQHSFYEYDKPQMTQLGHQINKDFCRTIS